MWCDPRAFCERLKEARKEDVERGHKSPKFEVCVVAAAANDDATLDKNVVKRAGQVLAAARDGTLVDELRRGERDDQGHVFT